MEIPYNGGDNIPTRLHHMLLSKIPSAKNELQLIESLAKQAP